MPIPAITDWIEAGLRPKPTSRAPLVIIRNEPNKFIVFSDVDFSGHSLMQGDLLRRGERMDMGPRIRAASGRSIRRSWPQNRLCASDCMECNKPFTSPRFTLIHSLIPLTSLLFESRISHA
jgi:hypothetical protein